MFRTHSVSHLMVLFKVVAAVTFIRKWGQPTRRPPPPITLYYLYIRDAQIPGATLPKQLHFAKRRLIFVGP
jgi:hypothetical protein